MLLEKDLTSNRLIQLIDEILLDRDKQQKMKEAAKQLGIPDASDKLFKLMLEMTNDSSHREGS